MSSGAIKIIVLTEAVITNLMIMLKRKKKKTQPRAIMDQEGASKETRHDLKALNAIIKRALFDYDQESNNILNKYR